MLGFKLFEYIKTRGDRRYPNDISVREIAVAPNKAATPNQIRLWFETQDHAYMFKLATNTRDLRQLLDDNIDYIAYTEGKRDGLIAAARAVTASPLEFRGGLLVLPRLRIAQPIFAEKNSFRFGDRVPFVDVGDTPERMLSQLYMLPRVSRPAPPQKPHYTPWKPN